MACGAPLFAPARASALATLAALALGKWQGMAAFIACNWTVSPGWPNDKFNLVLVALLAMVFWAGAPGRMSEAVWDWLPSVC